MRARIRAGGQWVDSDLTGSVQYGGERVTFGPAVGGGTVDEFFTWPDPAQPDWADDPINVGIRFAVTASGSWVGNRIWRPVTPSAGLSDSVAGFDDDAGTQIAAPAPVAAGSGYVSQLFAAPVGVEPGVTYIASYHTARYGFTRPSEGWTIPSLTTHLYTSAVDFAAVALYRYGGAGLRPDTLSSGFHFHVSPIVRYPA